MTVHDLLAQHIDQPDERHRCVLIDARHLRCLDCARTLVLPTGSAPPKTTSTSSSPPDLNAPNRCPHHPGQTVGACGPCRSEQLEATTPRPRPRPTADVAAGVAAARAALNRTTRGAPAMTTPASTPQP